MDSVQKTVHPPAPLTSPVAPFELASLVVVRESAETAFLRL